MPLRTGYSQSVISENIREMMTAGQAKPAAIAQAMACARVSFFHRNRHGALPTWLAFPAFLRLRAHYDAAGRPLHMNTHADSENAEMVRNRPSRKMRAVRRNPQSRDPELLQAARRFTRFTGNSDVTARKIRLSGPDKKVLAVGPCDGLLYTTKRDGRVEKYIHRFKRQSRPLLAASPDGKRLYLLGGAYTFTERGIVDR